MPVLQQAEAVSVHESGVETEAETTFTGDNIKTTTVLPIGQEEHVASFDQYLMSIIHMPHSLRMVCLTNLFCWMAHVRYRQNFVIYNVLRTGNRVNECFMKFESIAQKFHSPIGFKFK